MNKRNKLIALAAGSGLTAAAFVGTFTVASAANNRSTEQAPRPAWVDDNGFVNLDKAPDTIGVLDSNGDVVKDANGKPVRIPFPTPPADDGAARSAQPADPDAPDIMVPYAEQVQR